MIIIRKMFLKHSSLPTSYRKNVLWRKHISWSAEI